MKNVIILVIFVILFACSLERNNPFENETVPSAIGSEYFSITKISIDSIRINWEPTSATNNTIFADGYYIYRSGWENGNYSIIDTHITSVNLEYFDVDNNGELNFDENYYWYKISVFITTPNGDFEGYRSVAKTW